MTEQETSNDQRELTPWWLAVGVTPPTFCNVSPITGEFLGVGVADPSPLEPGVWLMPAHTYEGDAPIVFPGCAAIRDATDGMWRQVPDYRGQTVYDKNTRAASEHQELGELPEPLTLSAPSSDFDIWQGGQWVFDVKAKDATLTSHAALKKSLLAQCAGGMISTLQYAVDKGIADEMEIERLDAWRTYTVTLNRIIPAPVVAWPSSPDDGAMAAFLQSRGYEEALD